MPVSVVLDLRDLSQERGISEVHGGYGIWLINSKNNQEVGNICSVTLLKLKSQSIVILIKKHSALIDNLRVGFKRWGDNNVRSFK